jgi:mannose-6-phosphate isomerase
MAKIEKKSIAYRTGIEPIKQVERAWGREYWIVNNMQYCGKILQINAKKATSLHFHMAKHETMFLNDGLVHLVMVDPETGEEYVIEMQPGDCVEIPPGQPHRIKAIVDSFVHEFSTTHFEEDSYRCAPRVA